MRNVLERALQKFLRPAQSSHSVSALLGTALHRSPAYRGWWMRCASARILTEREQVCSACDGGLSLVIGQLDETSFCLMGGRNIPAME